MFSTQTRAEPLPPPRCPVCKGSGRVKVQSKVITRIEPFIPGEDDTELMTM
ncbi:MAG: hypothetical protein ACLVEE_14115 [Phocaeicola vulgatus]